MPINSTHSQYQSMLPRWRMMRDVCSGEDAIKAAGESYLPRANSDINTPEAMGKYKAYKQRAVFVEATKDTLDKYTGQAFKDDPILTVPTQLEYLKRDANGAGVSLYQIAQKGFEAQLSRGRFGLYVDYPQTNGNASIADIEQQALRPTIHFYAPEAIINWRTTTKGGKTLTTMVVLSEQVQQADDADPFSSKTIEQWRYLGLDVQGHYFVEVWRQTNDNNQAGPLLKTTKSAQFVQVGGRIYPKKAGNTPFTEIPFIVCGSDTNDWSEQNIPLESIARINIHHYVNSAAYEDSVFYCSHIQPWMSGVSQQRMDALEAQEIRIGAGQMIMLEDNGRFGFEQASPNTLAGDAMDRKYELMMQLGAKIAQTLGNKTATQANHDSDVQNSTASMAVANLNESFFDALVFCCQYLGIKPKDNMLFKAKQDFVTPTPEAGLMSALSQWVTSGLMPKSAAFDYARRFNLVDGEMTNEQLQQAIDAEMPKPR